MSCNSAHGPRSPRPCHDAPRATEAAPPRAHHAAPTDARFVGADALIGELSRSASKGRLDAALQPYLHPHVLIMDELGYLSHAADAANVLYRVINDRYLQRRPILLTTNKPLASLGDVVHDGDLAEAILDRLLERGVHFALRGRSYRTRHLTEEDSTPRRAKAS